jgi:hypothetical protein
VTIKLLLLVTIGAVLAGVVPYVPNVLDPPVPDQSKLFENKSTRRV